MPRSSQIEQFFEKLMVVEIEIEIKERGFTKYFCLCNNKGDLKGFQIKFETFFCKYLSQSDTC